ncbi:MAG: pepP [Chlamydiales bacterium]|jgi:Xaa-Pro aminopeptidase|nr:pepP [Chlamydiales bacterium]
MNSLNRINRLQIILKERELDSFVIEDSINLFYFLNLNLSAGTLIITQTDAQLFVDGRYIETCIKQAPIRVELTSDQKIKKYLTEQSSDRVKSLGIDSNRITYSDYLRWTKRTGEIGTETKHTITWVLIPTEGIIEFLRSSKDSIEIEYLKQAAELGAQGFDFICKNLKTGISEKELATELEIFWKRHQGERLAFEPIIAFGKNSSMPHYRSGEKKLTEGDTVLIDIGVVLNQYHSDMTRVVFWGDPHPKIKEIYSIVKQAQQVALDLCKPGIKLGQLDEAARQMIGEAGYKDFFNHSLGHGLGLEIHESPKVSQLSTDKDLELHSGMVITIEPGIYLPDIGGVRIEDTIVVTDQSYEILTRRSKDLLILGNK